MHYRGEIVGEFVADLVVEDSVILELQSVRRVVTGHEIQYLSATGKDVGLLLNFSERKGEVKRKVRVLPK